MPRVDLQVDYNPDRPWSDRWHDVLVELDAIENVYADIGMEDLRRHVEQFFKVCRELAEAIEWDAGVPAAVAYVHADPDLRICDGMAQTLKHHTRVGRDPITARISRIRTISGGQGQRATISWSRPSGANGSEDVLDLARKCVRTWRNFLTQHGLV